MRASLYPRIDLNKLSMLLMKYAEFYDEGTRPREERTRAQRLRARRGAHRQRPGATGGRQGEVGQGEDLRVR